MGCNPCKKTTIDLGTFGNCQDLCTPLIAPATATYQATIRWATSSVIVEIQGVETERICIPSECLNECAVLSIQVRDEQGNLIGIQDPEHGEIFDFIARTQLTYTCA